MPRNNQVVPKRQHTAVNWVKQNDFSGGVNVSDANKVLKNSNVYLSENFDLTSEQRLQKRYGFVNLTTQLDSRQKWENNPLNQEYGKITGIIQGKIQMYHSFTNTEGIPVEFWGINGALYKAPYLTEKFPEGIKWEIYDDHDNLINFYIQEQSRYMAQSIGAEVIFTTGSGILCYTNIHNYNDVEVVGSYYVRQAYAYKPLLIEFLDAKYGQNLFVPDEEERTKYINTTIISGNGVLGFLVRPNIVTPSITPVTVQPIINEKRLPSTMKMVSQVIMRKLGSQDGNNINADDIFKITNQQYVPANYEINKTTGFDLIFDSVDRYLILGMAFNARSEVENTLTITSDNWQILAYWQLPNTDDSSKFIHYGAFLSPNSTTKTTIYQAATIDILKNSSSRTKVCEVDGIVQKFSVIANNDKVMGITKIDNKIQGFTWMRAQREFQSITMKSNFLGFTNWIAFQEDLVKLKTPFKTPYFDKWKNTISADETLLVGHPITNKFQASSYYTYTAGLPTVMGITLYVYNDPTTNTADEDHDDENTDTYSKNYVWAIQKGDHNKASLNYVDDYIDMLDISPDTIYKSGIGGIDDYKSNGLARRITAGNWLTTLGKASSNVIYEFEIRYPITSNSDRSQILNRAVNAWTIPNTTPVSSSSEMTTSTYEGSEDLDADLTVSPLLKSAFNRDFKKFEIDANTKVTPSIRALTSSTDLFNKCKKINDTTYQTWMGLNVDYLEGSTSKTKTNYISIPLTISIKVISESINYFGSEKIKNVINEASQSVLYLDDNKIYRFNIETKMSTLIHTETTNNFIDVQSDSQNLVYVLSESSPTISQIYNVRNFNFNNLAMIYSDEVVEQMTINSIGMAILIQKGSKFVTTSNFSTYATQRYDVVDGFTLHSAAISENNPQKFSFILSNTSDVLYYGKYNEAVSNIKISEWIDYDIPDKPEIIKAGVNIPSVAEFFTNNGPNLIYEVELQTATNNWDLVLKIKYVDYENPIEFVVYGAGVNSYKSESLAMLFAFEKIEAYARPKKETDVDLEAINTLRIKVVNTPTILDQYYSTYQQIITPVLQETKQSKNRNFLNECTRSYYKNGYLMFYQGNKDNLANSKDTIFVSDLNRWNYVPQYSTLDNITLTNDEIQNIVGWNTEMQNVIFTNNSIHLLNFNGPSDIQTKLLSNEVGLWAPESVALADNKLFFVAQKGIYALISVQYTTQGANVKLISESINNLFTNNLAQIPRDSVGYNKKSNYHLFMPDVVIGVDDSDPTKLITSNRHFKLWAVSMNTKQPCWYIDQGLFLKFSQVILNQDSHLFIGQNHASIYTQDLNYYVDGDAESYFQDVESYEENEKKREQDPSIPEIERHPHHLKTYEIYGAYLESKGFDMEPWENHTKNFRQVGADIGIFGANVDLSLTSEVDGEMVTKTKKTRFYVEHGKVFTTEIDTPNFNANAGTKPGATRESAAWVWGVSRWGMSPGKFDLKGAFRSGKSIKIILEQIPEQASGFQVLGIGVEYKVKSLSKSF